MGYFTMRNLSEREIQSKLLLRYKKGEHKVIVKVLDFTDTTKNALFICGKGHLFEEKLHYVLYNESEIPCSHCFQSDKSRKRRSRSEFTEEKLIYHMTQSDENNAKIAEILWKHKRTANEETLATIHKTLNNMKGRVSHETGEANAEVEDTG